MQDRDTGVRLSTLAESTPHVDAMGSLELAVGYKILFMIESLSATSRWKTAIKSAVPFLIPMYMYVRGILSCVYLPPHLPFISFHFQLTYPLRNCSSKSTVDNTIVLASPKVTSCPYKVSGNRHKGSNNSLRTRPNTMTFKLPSILARPSAFAFLFDWFCRWDI